MLIAIVPTLALIAILLFVSEDSQRGKADARLAAGLRTATAIYRTQTAAATRKAESSAAAPDLAAALGSPGRAAERAAVERAAGQPPAGRVELYDNAGNLVTVA